jgi:hypothetical protein
MEDLEPSSLILWRCRLLQCRLSAKYIVITGTEEEYLAALAIVQGRQTSFQLSGAKNDI